MVPAECFQGAFHVVDLADIDLHDFGPVAFPGIGHRNGQGKGFRGLFDHGGPGAGSCHRGGLAGGSLHPQGWAGELCLANFKGGVAEPEAERKQVIGGVAVGAAVHGIILEIAQVVRVFIERHGEFSRRVVVSKKHIGNRQTARFTGVPGLKDRIA